MFLLPGDCDHSGNLMQVSWWSAVVGSTASGSMSGALPIAAPEASADAASRSSPPVLASCSPPSFRLGSGELGISDENHWRLDFQSGHRVVQPIRQRCRDACQVTLPEGVRDTINAGRRWAAIR